MSRLTAALRRLAYLPRLTILAMVGALLASGLGPVAPGQNSPERSLDLSKVQLTAVGTLPGFRTTKVVPAEFSSDRQGAYGIAVSPNGRYLAYAEIVSSSPSTQTAVLTVRDLNAKTPAVVASLVDHTFVASAVSDDGRYVLFEDIGPGNARKFLRWDRNSGTSTSVMIDPTTGADLSDSGLFATYRLSAMSADGSKVVFYSSRSDLVAGDANGRIDLFARDMNATPAGSTVRASLSTSGAELPGGVVLYSPAISGDGTKAAYVVNDLSTPGKAGPVLIYTLSGGAVSVGALPGAASGGYVGAPDLSWDGTWLSFMSAATAAELGAPAVSAYGNPIAGRDGPYLRNLTTGATVAVPAPPSPPMGYLTAAEPRISADGRWVFLVVNVVGSFCTTGNAYLYDRDRDGNGTFDEAGATSFTLESRTNGGKVIDGCEVPTFLAVGNGPTAAFGGLSTDVLGSFRRLVLRDNRSLYKPDQGAAFGPCAITSSACLVRNPTNLRSDPVNTATGALVHQATDLASGGIGAAFAFTRTYNSNDPAGGPLGQGWTHSYLGSLSVASGVATVRMPGGQQAKFTDTGGGTWKGFPGVQGSLAGDATSGWTLTTKSQFRYGFGPSGRLTSIKDRNNQGVTIAHNGAGDVSTVSDAAGRVATFAYTSGLLTGISMSDGRTIGLAYTSGKLTAVTDPDGAITRYTYVASGNGAGLMDTFRDGDNRLIFDNTYDSQGRVVAQVDGEGNGGSFSYLSDRTVYTDARGKPWTDFYDGNVLLGTANPYDDLHQFAYDELGNMIGVMLPDGAWEGVDYDDRGNAVRVRHPDDTIETTAFNAFNDPTEHTNAEGESVTIGSDAAGNPASVTDAVGTTYTPHDSLGRPTSITDPTSRTTTLGYDAQHNPTSSTDNAGNVTTHGYDGVGRKTSTVSPLGNVPGATPADYRSTQTYSPAGDPLVTTSPEGRTITNNWSPGNKLNFTTDPSGRSSNYGYDLVGNVKTITAPGQGTTTLERDAAYNVTARTDGNGHRWKWTYDDANRLIREEDPEGNVWTWAYDSRGRPIVITDPEGNATAAAGDGTVTITYDAMNRVIKRDFSDPATHDVLFQYDKVGRRIRMDDATLIPWIYTYDDAGRLATVDHGSRHWETGYDAAGRPTTKTIPTLGTVNQAYDAAGRPADLTFGALVVGHTWDADGQLDLLNLPNGVVEDRTWTRDGLLQRILTTGPGAVVVDDRAYTYNQVGNPLNETRPSGVTAYGYDTAHRLNLVCEQASCPGALDPKSAWTYDAAGNRRTQTTPGLTRTSTFDDADRLTRTSGGLIPTVYTNNRRGERVAEGVNAATPSRTYAWFQSGLMRSTTQGLITTSWVYDGDGRRYSETTGLTMRIFTWDGSELAAITGGLAATQTFLHGPSGLLATFTAGQPAQWHHGDNVGTTTALTGPDGARDRQVDRDAWGNLRSQTINDPSGPGSPLNYTGELHDDSGLIHLRARQYDPRTGTFLSADPISEPLASPAASAYSYVGGRPTALVDPSGMVQELAKRPFQLVPCGADGSPGQNEDRKLYVTCLLNGPGGRQVRQAQISHCSLVVATPGASLCGSILFASEDEGSRPEEEPAPAPANRGPRNLKDLPPNARTTNNTDYLFDRLDKNNDIPKDVASDRLHAIKAEYGLRGDDNVVLDLSGNVYDPVSGDYLGSLTQGGGRP